MEDIIFKIWLSCCFILLSSQPLVKIFNSWYGSYEYVPYCIKFIVVGLAFLSIPIFFVLTFYLIWVAL